MPATEGNVSGRIIRAGALFFALALVLRVLFLTATPDASGPHSPYYEGDTPVWLEYARAIRSGDDFELGLPLRPPGVAYLVAGLWDGETRSLLTLKLAWCLLGAVVVSLFFLAVQRSFGFAVAIAAALIASASTGLMMVSTAPNNEIPYLLLVVGALVFWEPVRHRPRIRTLLCWSALHALACLVRVEHLLFFGLVSAYLLWAWARVPGGRESWARSLGLNAVTAAFFVLLLLPWHLHTWGKIEKFNNEALAMNPVTEQAYARLEEALSGLQWSEDAIRARDALPGYSRRAMANFVAATVAMRGGGEVTGDAFRVIEDAFGSTPEPLRSYPFVALYGGLNFHLANNAFATGGFTRAPLQVPPPLTGGPSNYPGFLIAGLPPPDLTFTYPPHVEIVNHGYRLGWSWILAHPGEYFSLALAKLRIFWSGATLGLGGYNLPLGMDGTRRPVDLAVPQGGAGLALWRLAGLAVLLGGLWVGRREEGLVPWVFLLATKTLTTLAFFGYAREGAVLIPVLALMSGILIVRGLARLPALAAGPDLSMDGARKLIWAGCLAALFLVTAEGVRWISGPVVALDGREVAVEDPFPGAAHLERSLEVR